MLMNLMVKVKVKAIVMTVAMAPPISTSPRPAERCFPDYAIADTR